MVDGKIYDNLPIILKEKTGHRSILYLGLPNNHLVLQNCMISIGDVCLPLELIFHLFDMINIGHAHLPMNQVLVLWHHIDKIVL
jgi:hypothetical protein